MIYKTAVVVTIIHPDGYVLMVSRPENPSQYGIPGGKVEDGESILNAAIREVQEETGIKLDADKVHFLVDKTVPSRREPDVSYTTYCFVTQLDEHHPTVSPEGLKMWWVEPWQIVMPPYAYFNAGVYQALVEDGWVERS
jgi:8-oxo-dGTP pyrophosphatase MutT (NUDIX family)